MKTHASENSFSTILLIGSGRLATHLQYWFQFNQHNSTLLTWDRHQDPRALAKYCLSATHVWLALSDAAIVPFFEKNLQGYDFKTIHFSGALHDNRIISTHPLMTFSTDLYTEHFYNQITFAINGCDSLPEALPGFTKNPFFILPTEKKALYHALCVVAANFPQMLWNEVFKLAEANHIPTNAFHPYIQKTAENFLALQDKALTGPFVRKDLETIDKNKKSLAGHSLEKIYTAFEKEFLK
jgi:2-dehydropantoate 2-reductase